MKPKSKAQKQLAAAKAVGKKRIAAEEARQAEPSTQALKSTVPVIKGEVPSQRVFLDSQRRAYILLTVGNSHNTYLTIQDEAVATVKLERGEFKIRELIPYAQDLNKAVRTMYKSFLPKTNAAMREMCGILELPIPELSEEVKQIRKAAGERLKAAKNLPPAAGDDTVVTLVKGATVGPSTRATKVLTFLADAEKQTRTVGQLSALVGKPVGAAVAKLLALNLVTVSKK